MSKIYNQYLELKSNDKNSLYLFKNGNFYIFLADDCDFINEYVVLKKTKFSKECYKCGFPINSLDDYLKVFNNHKLNIKIVNENDNKGDLVKYIENININNITPLEALNYLQKIKELL